MLVATIAVSTAAGLSNGMLRQMGLSTDAASRLLDSRSPGGRGAAQLGKVKRAAGRSPLGTGALGSVASPVAGMPGVAPVVGVPPITIIPPAAGSSGFGALPGDWIEGFGDAGPLPGGGFLSPPIGGLIGPIGGGGGGGVGGGGGGGGGGVLPPGAEITPSVPVPAGPIPEPDTWGMLLIGFGAIGWAIRRSRTPTPHPCKSARRRGTRVR